MSINATSNYMSNADIMAWMETKTEGLYSKMRASMDTSNDRADAEDALTDINAKIDQAERSGQDPIEAYTAINDAIKKYGGEFPEVTEVLQPMATALKARYDAVADAAVNRPLKAPTTVTTGKNGQTSASVNQWHPPAPTSVKIEKEEGDAWIKNIQGKLDVLGKQDQLGLIHIQDLNSQLNRAQDTASALMASAAKSADTIVSHIG